MGTIICRGQTAKAEAMTTVLSAMKQELDKRAEMWKHMSYEQKKRAYQNRDKDPVFDKFCQIVDYACDNFKDLVEIKING